MNILHINSYYNAGKFYKNLYDQQANSGLNIDVFVPVTTTYENKFFDFGEYTTVSKNHNKYDRYIFHLKHHKILKDITKKYDIEKYSLIHAHSLFSNGYIAMKLKEKYKIPYIVAVRNTDVNVFFKKMIHLRKMGVKILKNADYIVFLSESYRDLVIDEYIPESDQKSTLDKTKVIPNGIDEFWFDNLAQPKEINNRTEIKLLQIGDLNKNKNIETTVKAVKILNEEGFNVSLSIVGKIEDKKVFEKIKDLDFVNYLGYQSKEELINIYRENYIFVLPSVTETFGLVYPEAMSQGLPVIYTRGQGFDRQFKEGDIGYSVNCYNESEIAKKVIEIISEYETISSKAINKVKKFRWNSIAKDYFHLYNSITK